MTFALDLDGVIGTNPEFFKWFTFILHKNKQWIDIVTSRNPSRVEETKKELSFWGITYDDIHFMSSQMPRDYKTQGEWKRDKVIALKSDIWMDNEFKIYDKVCGVDFSECRAERITI
jgi:hypothetical protein